MKRVKIVVAYDGTNYCGWQVQPNGLSVQEVLEKHLSDLLCEEIRITGASRTDAGVHALGNVAAFNTSARMAADRISFAMNTRLPADIRIQESAEVPMEFHPRFANTVKTYEYRIFNRKFPDPTKRLYSFFYHYPLDVEKMQRAASYLVGEHDFKSFCMAASAVGKPTCRNVHEISFAQEEVMGERTVVITVKGNAFLHSMVRTIVGTLVMVGRGRRKPEWVADVLQACDRCAAGENAPAAGLVFWNVSYDGVRDHI